MHATISAVAKGLAAAALVTGVLAPAAAGGSAPVRVELAAVPLPKSAIGSVARPLQLSRFSGAVSNAAAAARSMNFSVKTVNKLGRVWGYVLDYGVAASGRSGVTDVSTSIEKYKTAAAAKRGLAFWRKNDSLLGLLNHGSFSVRNFLFTKPDGRLKIGAVGQAWFAYLTQYQAPNIAPFSTFDQRFREGKYLLQVQVSGTPGADTRLASRLRDQLDMRLELALKGRLHAKPPVTPPPLRGAAPHNGPDLSTLALKATDLSGTVQVREGYVVDPAAISCYTVTMRPAGPFVILWHDTEWYATANQAAFEADRRNALHLSYRGSTGLDLSSVGHNAQGVLGLSGDPSHVYAGGFSLSVGHLAEFVAVIKDARVQASDLQTLAQTVAARLDPIYTG